MSLESRAVVGSRGVGSGFSLANDGFRLVPGLLTRDQCDLIVRHWRHAGHRPRALRAKALATSDRLFFQVATRPALVALLGEAIGEDVVLWGVRP